MSHTSHDTIFALASGGGRTGVSVFRMSGPQAASILEQLSGRTAPRSHLARLRRLRTADDHLIDEALVLFMKAPKSFTGEDVVELHTHGSTAVREALADALLSLGARQAEPGEFTRRAFEHGRMDLTEAEGLADLIDADTAAQHQQALRQMSGGLKAVYENWRSDLIDALAAIEGEIDFPDEKDVPDTLSHTAYAPVSQALASMQAHLENADRGERIRSGLDITIIGPPNAGKSSLLNQLAGREAAIVSHIPGTTRDIVEVQLTLGGLPVRVSDTAGIRHSQDQIEREGIKRAEKRAKDSDIRIVVLDASSSDAELKDWQNYLGPDDFFLLNKTDLLKVVSRESLKTAPNHAFHNSYTFHISAKTSEGLDEFLNTLEQKISQRYGLREDAGLTRARHRDCVNRAASALERAMTMLASAPELAGEDVRTALHAIRELAGEVDIDMVLDRVFSRFCIGK